MPSVPGLSLQPEPQPGSYPSKAAHPTSPQGGLPLERGFQTQLVRSLRGQGSGHARDVAGSTLWRTLRRTLQRTLDARSGTRSDASSGTRSGTRIGLGLLRGNLTSAAAPTGARGLAGHGPVLSSKQLGRLGGGLPAVLGCVFLCCRQPALKVSQLALEVLLLALKVLYERLKVWGRGATRARHPPPRP